MCFIVNEPFTGVNRPLLERAAQRQKSAQHIRKVFGDLYREFYGEGMPSATVRAYIARDNPAAAERFGLALVEKAELLKTFPLLGKKVKGTEEDRVLV